MRKTPLTDAKIQEIVVLSSNEPDKWPPVRKLAAMQCHAEELEIALDKARAIIKHMSDICDPIPEDNNAASIRNRQQDADDIAAQRDESIRTLRERRDWLRARIIAKKSVGWETQYDEREERALTWAVAELLTWAL